MSFDSIFELAIVILVGLEYLIVKIGRKFWFLQLFFSGSFLLLYYRWKWPNFDKKKLVFGSNYHNCCNFLQAALQGHYMYALINSFFDPLGLNTTLPDLSNFMS